MTRTFRNYLGFLAGMLIMMLIVPAAFARDSNDCNDRAVNCTNGGTSTNAFADSASDSNSTADAQSQSDSHSEGGAGGSATSMGGAGGTANGGAATIDGVVGGAGGSVGPVSGGAGGASQTGDYAGGTFAGGDYSSESSFFSFSTTFPEVSGCITGWQVGGGGDGGGGIIGANKLNVDCWMDRLGEAEGHVDMRARLKCGSRHFRNAVAYEFPKRDRQAQCIKYATNIWKQEIDYLRSLPVGDGSGK